MTNLSKIWWYSMHFHSSYTFYRENNYWIPLHTFGVQFKVILVVASYYIMRVLRRLWHSVWRTTFMQLNIHSTVIYVYKIADHACDDDEKTMLGFKQANILVEMNHSNVSIKKGWICGAFVKCTSFENFNSMKAGGAAAVFDAIWWNNHNYVNVYH